MSRFFRTLFACVPSFNAGAGARCIGACGPRSGSPLALPQRLMVRRGPALRCSGSADELSFMGRFGGLRAKGGGGDLDAFRWSLVPCVRRAFGAGFRHVGNAA